MSTEPARYAERELTVDGKRFRFIDTSQIPGASKLPCSLKILLENAVRRSRTPEDGRAVAERIVRAGLAGQAGEEIDFMPARVLFQDFTGVPVFVDFAAMRDEAVARGADPSLVNPQIPCDLIIDHSVAADVSSTPCAARENARIEAERNAERFAFLKWSATAFKNVRIVPPGKGICHQLNIERLCSIVTTMPDAEDTRWALFDTLVGTDSHTTTAGGVGVLGWGVGGIEAEAAALGQPITMSVPAVVGMRLHGELAPGVSAMDVALSFAERLRAVGVVGKIVECFGEGLGSLTATQRATIANMSPEYGCTATYFPPDETSLAQLETFGRPREDIALARSYLAAQGMLGARTAQGESEATFAQVIDFDLSSVVPSLAGPARPHDRFGVQQLRERFRAALTAHGRSSDERFEVALAEGRFPLRHGALAIAAVTSCTTATDPAMMVACGLVAKRAVELGCKPVPWVKKVLAPGSHATTELLARAGLLEPLAQLGFAVCGWGCMSCIGNSGPLSAPMHELAAKVELVSVLSGNRNFEGRISPDVSQNYLCAPALVVALSLAGTADIDLSQEPVCEGATGPVYLRDLVPADAEVDALVNTYATEELYRSASEGLEEGDAAWQGLALPQGATYAWNASSTYVRRPTFLDDAASMSTFALEDGRCLALLGDFVTTDHISPAGTIDAASAAARYLHEHGIADADFNTYGARRGNHEVLMRGAFANTKLRNRLAQGAAGGMTRDPVSGSLESIFDAAKAARAAHIPLIVIAGKMYGSGSSRDWAAKGPALLGVRAVIAQGFERIHRSNLIGMGIVPLEFMEGEGAESLGLSGTETFSIAPIDLSHAGEHPMQAQVTALSEDGSSKTFTVRVRVDTPTEGAYLCSGGILPYVLGNLVGC